VSVSNNPLPAFVYPNLDQGLGRAKKAVDYHREDYVLGNLTPGSNFPLVSSIGAGVANSTVQAYYLLPMRAKIAKVMVAFSAINALTGHSFNIVSGTATYTASATTIPGNDNSSVPNVSLRDGFTGLPTTISGGAGICTNPGVPGNTFWNADVIINATNFPTATTANGTWLSSGLGLAQTIIPNSPDAVWESGTLLTLRVTTPASTGSITNFLVAFTLESAPLSASYPAFPNSQTAPGNIPVPGVDF
jgi:hypothetical protein